MESGKIIFSPSDLTLYMDSPFASWMDHLALTHPDQLPLSDDKDEFTDLLQQKGMQHETAVLKSLLQQESIVTQIKKGPNAVQDTLAAMQSGAEVIYQAALSLLPFKGYADFLIKVEGNSKLGNYYYEVWDTKVSMMVKPKFIIQLCCYVEMLEEIQGRRPDYFAIVLGKNDPLRFYTNDYFHYYKNLKQRFLQYHQTFSVEKRPNPADSNQYGNWSDYAQQLLKQADHLSQIATITKNQIKKLNKAGITTMDALADTSLNIINGINPDVLLRLKAQAKIQKESIGKDVPLYRILTYEVNKRMGLSMLPPNSPMDIYFDIEGYPFEDGGLEYLWGVSYFEEKGKRQYKDFWAHNQNEEKKSFQAFIEWTYARWLKDPTMHIYHYANYEIAACRKLMGRYGLCEYEVDQLLRNEVFVDLYKIVKGSLLLGEPRYSIKNVEHLYREKRTTDVGSGGDSVVVYERWREAPDGATWENSAILKAIRDYNIDDCNSTHELTEWLRLRQREQGISFIGNKEVKDAVESEDTSARSKLRNRLLEKATTLKDEGFNEAARVTTLLAWILEFHRRELKPMYWRLFDRLGLTDEELINDIDCLALCARTDKEPYKLKPKDRNLVYEYQFDPTQEFKAAAENYFVLGQYRPDGKNICVTYIKENSLLDKGIIALKTGEQLENIITLIPDENVPVKPIPEALTSQVEAFEKGMLNDTAIYDLLMRRPPRIIGHIAGEPIAPSNNPAQRLEEIIEKACKLDNSYLTIQGPPGSGKTFTAKHIIAELLKQEKRIGISSNSHKAINHLLISTAQYCKEKGISAYFACTKDTDEILDKLNIDIYKNEHIITHLKPSCVIGTPAWGFSRNDLKDAFDYLFIDEAGQVCLANLIAMSQSTKNIILMGDQMQLSQPSQGTHPEDSGLSILDYLLHSTPTIPQSMGVFLGTTYRMHSLVNKFISTAIYEGKLECAPENDRQCIKVPINHQGILNKEAGIITVPVFHEGNTQASDEEVKMIEELAHKLLGRIFKTKEGEERPMTWNDFLFVAPYNHQVNKLRIAFGEKAKVGSVDKFQGQEAPVIFLSMCASNAHDSPRGIKFLLEKNRMNVAISRAQCMAIIVYSPNLIQSSVSTIEQLEMMNLFSHLLSY